jgi:membrane protein implicated in regulation of membrane protease activity
MTTEAIPPQERKLKSLRRILWLSFAGVSILFMVLVGGTYMALLVLRGSNASGPLAFTSPLLLGLALLGAVTFTGVACLVIYYVIKRRLEREDELFF